MTKNQNRTRANPQDHLPVAGAIAGGLAKAESVDDLFGKDGIFAKLFANALEAMMEEALTEETAARRCAFGWGEVSFYELQLYSMRHLAGHAAQLKMAVGQQTGDAPGWVTVARE